MGNAARAGITVTLLAIVAGWWWWAAAEEAAPPAVTAAEAPAVRAQIDVARGPAPIRVAAEPSSTKGHVAAVVPPQAGLPRVRASVITAEVLDDAGVPVEGATVELWGADYELRKPTDQDLRSVVWLGPNGDVPLASLVTDAEGHCAWRLEREFAYATARHPQFGRSIARAVGHLELGSNGRVQLWLLRPVVVRGTVIDADGAPVGHAIVKCNDTSSPGKFVPIGSFTANAAGRFQFEAAFGWSCKIVARRHAQLSMTVDVVARDGVDVLVPFAGACSIRGLVRDASGRPVANARVEGVLAGAYGPGSSPFGIDERFTTDADGAFEVQLGFGTFLLVASLGDRQNAHWSRPREVTVALHDRHPFVELMFDDRMTLRGTVWKHDGSPAGSGNLEIAWERPDLRRRIGVGSDGTFSITLPPCPRVSISGPGLEPIVVASDAQDVRLVQMAPQPPITIVGEVFAADGTQVEDFTLQWARVSAQVVLMPLAAAAADIRGMTFRLTTPMRGPDWHLVVTPVAKAMPPALAGPFTAPGEHSATVRLPRLATVPVRVLATGQPARGLEVNLVPGPTATQRPRRTDAQGRVNFEERWPGVSKILVMRGAEVVGERDIDVLPGPNAEIVIDVTL